MKLTKREGFTLVEVMVALVVLMIGILAVVMMNIMYVKSNTFNQQMSTAIVLAQDKLEEFKMLARSDRDDFFSPLDFDYMVGTGGDFGSIAITTDGGVTYTSFPVNGLVSGAGGERTSPHDIIYPTLALTGDTYDASSGGNYAAANPEYSVTDTPTDHQAGMATAFDVSRTLTIVPILLADGVTQSDYALIRVEAEWVDPYGTDRTMTLETLVHRRQ